MMARSLFKLTANVSWLCVCYFGLQTLAFKDKFYSQNNSTKPLLADGTAYLVQILN